MTIKIPRPDRTESARRRLARGVCAKLQLPVDDVLAHVIGTGKETSSEGAVVTWLDGSGFDPTRTTLQEACDALERDLSDRLGV